MAQIPGGGGATATVRGPLRWVLLGAGFFFVGLAGLGVVLPVLPTTPFLLVAAACFARSSPRFYNWLLDNRVFGPLIRDWRAHRCIPLRAKVMAVALIAGVGGSSVIWFVEPVWGKVALAALLTGLVVWLLRHPSTPPIIADGGGPT